MLKKLYCKDCQTRIEWNRMIENARGKYYCPHCMKVKNSSEVVNEETQSAMAESAAELAAELASYQD